MVSGFSDERSAGAVGGITIGDVKSREGGGMILDSDLGGSSGSELNPLITGQCGVRITPSGSGTGSGGGVESPPESPGRLIRGGSSGLSVGSGERCSTAVKSACVDGSHLSNGSRPKIGAGAGSGRPSANFSVVRGLSGCAATTTGAGRFPAAVGIGGLTGLIVGGSGWKPAQAGTSMAPKAVLAIRSRRVIPDLARSDVSTEYREPPEIPRPRGESSRSVESPHSFRGQSAYPLSFCRPFRTAVS